MLLGRNQAEGENFCCECNFFRIMVALTGIEPVLSALRGQRVNQLHHSAIYLKANNEPLNSQSEFESNCHPLPSGHRVTV